MRSVIVKDFEAVLAGGQFIGGRFSDQIERDFERHTGSRHAVSLNSATTGLQIALRFAGACGREVLVPAASFVTDVSAVLFEGATPVLVDCDPATLALDIKDLARKITSKSAAIIWVHLTGYISDQFEQIRELAENSGVLLIEDASHAFGAEMNGRKAGSFGDVSVFSLYPTKLITSGTGGLLTTNNSEIAQLARKLRLFGKDEKTGEINVLGNDWFLDELRACVGAHQVAALDLIIGKRRAAAKSYSMGIDGLPRMRVLKPIKAHHPAWYQFPVFLDDGVDHDAVQQKMKAAGIACKRIYKPLHHEAIFRKYGSGEDLKGAEYLLDRSLCLPMFTGITENQIDKVTDTLRRILKGTS